MRSKRITDKTARAQARAVFDSNPIKLINSGKSEKDVL